MADREEDPRFIYSLSQISGLEPLKYDSYFYHAHIPYVVTGFAAYPRNVYALMCSLEKHGIAQCGLAIAYNVTRDKPESIPHVTTMTMINGQNPSNIDEVMARFASTLKGQRSKLVFYMDNEEDMLVWRMVSKYRILNTDYLKDLKKIAKRIRGTN